MVRMVSPHFKEAFELGYRDALLVQSAFFITYLLFARLSGSITARIGFRNGVVLGLALMAVGSLGLSTTTLFGSFHALLPSIFVLASGITFLQVAANPLAASTGPLHSASGNLTFAQAFNSLGTVAAPLIAAVAFLGTTESPLVPVRWLFLGLSICLTGLAFAALIFLRDRGSSQSIDTGRALRGLGIYARNRLVLAVIAIFLYVGAEVAISTTLVNLLEDDGMIAAGRDRSAMLSSLFWIGMLVGRFVGVALLVRYDRRAVLGGAALASAFLCLIASNTTGLIAAGAILATGLTGGLQFPTIFTIASADLQPADRARAAGWLCTGIVGGGIVPLLYGEIADRNSLEFALIVPAICFALIAVFAFAFGRTLVIRTQPA